MALKDINILDLKPVYEPQQPQQQQRPSSFNPLNLLQDLPSLAVSGLESAVGTPGSILQGLLGLGNIGSQALTGRRPFPEQIPLLPTIESLRERRRTGPTGELFEPKTRAGEILQETVSDVVSLLHPIGFGTTLAKAATAGGLGNLAKHGSKELGFGPTAQEGIKLGTMLGTSLVGSPSIKSVADNLFETVETQIPSRLNLSLSPIKDPLNKIERIVTTGLKKSPGKDVLKDAFSSIERVREFGDVIPASEAVQFYRDINASFSKDIPKNIRGPLGELLGGFKDVINQAKDTHPEWVNSFNKSNEIYRTLHTSGPVNEFVKRVTAPIANKFINPISAVLLGHFTGNLPQALGISGGALGARGIAYFVDQVLRSPAIRNEYIKMVTAAAKENAPAVTKAARKLDAAIGKSDFGREMTSNGTMQTDKEAPVNIEDLEFIGYD